MELDIRNLCVSIGKKEIVHGVSLHVPKGKFAVLLGPNGSGKSTLLKALYRTLPFSSGRILLDGRDAAELSGRSFAADVAVLTQFSNIAFEFSCMEIVMMGRTPHLALLSRESEHDCQIALHALALVGMEDFAARSFSTLSGGEKQRILLARAITQEPRLMVLDEPTNHLDIHYQLQVLALVRRLGVTCIAALHDLTLAAQFADVIFLLKEGSLVCTGSPREVLTPETIRSVYHVESRIFTQPDTGGMVISCLPPDLDKSKQGGSQNL